MDLKSLYSNVGGDYELIMARMGNKEERVIKFLKKFLDDRSFDDLKKALSERNAADMFRAAHTMKGVALNLELHDLQLSSGQLTDAVRDGAIPDNIQELFRQLEKDYNIVIDSVSQL